jgi:hypothetical protein
MLQFTRSLELSLTSCPSVFGRIGTRAFAVVTVLCTVGCNLETKAIPTTQIVVDVHADAVVRSRTEELQLDVWSAEHRDQLGEREHVLTRTLPPRGDALEAAMWPIRLVFEPRNGDPDRVFELLVTTRSADGAMVARARVITGYVKHEARYVSARLEAACVGIACQSGETCSAGACQSAWLDAADLPYVPGKLRPRDRDAPPDAGADASGLDAAVDAAADAALDAGVDAGDAAIDASVDLCLTNNGGCDPLVTCESLGFIVACGQCPNGFADDNANGTRCTDIDECETNNGGCDVSHAKCTNLPGGFECKCEKGFHGNGKECSVNVPCSDDATVCDLRATCTAMKGKKMCTCGAGFEGDGGRCTDIDECALQPERCGAHGKCVNTEGTFECTCDPGYLRTADACVDIDECAANTDDCTNRPNACVNTQGGFMCKCPKGYTGRATGSEGCNDTDECYEHMANCSSNADCMNTRGSFTCTCKSGFMGNGVNCTGTGSQ